MSAKTDRIKGRAKQIEGKLTGDKVRIAQGTIQRVQGEVEGAVARVAREVKGDIRRIKTDLASATRKH